MPRGDGCPKGRKAEDGPIAARYPLQETNSGSYPVRTEKNIKDSDGTLVLTHGPARGGTATTIKFVQENGKPYLVIDLGLGGDPVIVKNWQQANKVGSLNVAGPRESEAPGIHDRAVEFLRRMLR
jgi:hypothetical protein